MERWIFRQYKHVYRIRADQCIYEPRAVVGRIFLFLFLLFLLLFLLFLLPLLFLWITVCWCIFATPAVGWVCKRTDPMIHNWRSGMYFSQVRCVCSPWTDPRSRVDISGLSLCSWNDLQNCASRDRECFNLEYAFVRTPVWSSQRLQSSFLMVRINRSDDAHRETTIRELIYIGVYRHRTKLAWVSVY